MKYQTSDRKERLTARDRNINIVGGIKRNNLEFFEFFEFCDVELEPVV